MNNQPLKAAVSRFIKENRSRLLNDWFEIVRQPSISSTGEGVEACCDLIADKMRALGLEVQKHDVKPYPVIIGRYGRSPDRKTILIYAHYDVQPVEPLELWRTPPFEPTIVGDAVYGRGTADNKAPLMAHLEAVDFWLNEAGDIPVNLIFLFEGCEESGSLGLQEFLEENRKALQADLVFFSDGPKDPNGLPIIALGAKGLLSLTFNIKTMKKNVHSRYAPVLPSAAWELIELMNRLKRDDVVHVPGFYDDILEPSPREMQILNSMPSAEEQMEKDYGAKPLCHGRSFYDQLNNTPTFNISFMTSGSSGSIVPATASATVDIRLVANQSPDKIFEAVKQFVRDEGFENVEVIKNSSQEPSKTDINTRYLPVIEKATKGIYGEYVIYPCRPSTAPDYLWTNVLRLPAIQVRWSDPDSDNHAPNEHLSIAEYFDGIALTIQVIQEISQMREA